MLQKFVKSLIMFYCAASSLAAMEMNEKNLMIFPQYKLITQEKNINLKDKKAFQSLI